LLEVRDVHASYGKFEVLKGVTLAVAEREWVCLIGPNGAGKSTILRTITGFLKPLQGEVVFREESIGGLPPKEIVSRGISYVFQRDSVFPHMSVLENLEMGAYIRRDKQAIKESLSIVQELFPILRERKHEPAKNFSGGQRRMLEIARALMASPVLLLLDEPSMGLAPKVQRVLFEKIEEIRQTGVTVLMVEQNARQGLSYSDRAYVLENGKTILEGSGEQLLRNPRVINAYLGGKKGGEYE